MMRVLSCSVVFLGFGASTPGQEKSKVLVSGLKDPTAVAVGLGGKIYVTVAGRSSKETAGAVLRIDNGRAIPFSTGLHDPTGIVAFQKWLFVSDKDRVLRIDPMGKTEVFAAAAAFPATLRYVWGITVDEESGTLYAACESRMAGRSTFSVCRITPQGKVALVADENVLPKHAVIYGLTMDGQSHLLLTNRPKSEVLRLRLSDRQVEKVCDGFEMCCGVTRDQHGRVFVSSGKESLLALPRPDASSIVVAHEFKSIRGICLDPTWKFILAVDSQLGTLTAIPINIPGWEVDETPLPLKPAIAFPDLQWTGWEPETKTGKPNPLRPLVLTHAGDGSNRVFVATEQGVIHSFPNDQKATKTNIFLDLTDRVSYRDEQNEEGFLGLAFHPKYKETGEFFVFYTPKKTKGVNVLSRFRVSKDNPDKADPNSEEELMRFKKPFWNHDGGTVCFGPDGFLYVTHGDGGAANDPFDNGQNLNSYLGKIHRIDVDHKDPGKNYAIPKDNPFVGRKDAKPEIWSYGHRNIWRMAFDRKTGKFWAGEVGQNLFEEINLIQKGGNFGWNRREGLHPFGPKGEGTSKKFIDPIWEYHHDVGKSITGGGVYRGPRLPELDGMYIYGDYISNKIWALKYDEAKGRVVANRPIKDLGMPMFSFGEDEQGEMYMLCPATTGKGIFWFVKQ